jgi:Replication initiator protein A
MTYSMESELQRRNTRAKHRTSDTPDVLGAAQGADPAELEKLLYEINLLRLEGHLFCFDPKKAARRGRMTFDFERAKQQPITITPNPLHGYPSVLAYRVLQAIMKKLTDYGIPRREVVSFSRRELIDMLGRRSYGGRDSKDLVRALMQLQGTQVTCALYEKEQKRWVTATFSVLQKVLLSGLRSQVETCAVYLEPWIVDSLNARHFACLNFERLRRLEPLGMALFKRLYYNFSLLFDGKNGDIRFTKNYGDICRTWLGGLRELRYKSNIEKDQLGRHLKMLRTVGLIRKYEIERNAKGDGFNLTFYPGTGFFRDYETFYTQAHQNQLQFRFAADRHTIQAPLELVEFFYKRLYGVERLDAQLVSPKETALAAELIEQHGLSGARDLIEFALEAAPTTGFSMKTFGAVRTYLGEWGAARERRAQARERLRKQAHDAAEERLREAYENERRKKGNVLIAELSEDARHALMAQATKAVRARHPNPSPVDSMLIRIESERMLLSQSGFPDFAAWRSRQVH